MLKVTLGNDKQSLDFSAMDCHFLDIAPDMSLKGEVTIDRSSHEGMNNSTPYE